MTSYALAFAWEKVALVTMAYPVLYRAPFPASFSGVSFIVVAVAGASIVALYSSGQISGAERDFPSGFLIVPIGYLVASLLFGAFFYLNYRMHRDRKVPWRRLDEELQ